MNKWIWMTAAGIAAAIIIFLLPLSPQNWGDDFAMYCMHTLRMAGQSEYSDLFVYNPDAPLYSPPAYPPGFPALLLPVYLIVGFNLHAFQVSVTVWVVFLAVLVAAYVHHSRIHYLYAATAGALVLFHSLTLELRQWILSDIPFLVFVLLFFIAYEKSWKYFYIAAFGIMALLIRNTGILLPLAFVADWILMKLRNEKLTASQKLGGILVLASWVIFYFVLPASPAWTSLNNHHSVWHTMHENYYIYKNLIEYYFMHLLGIDENIFKPLSFFIGLIFLLGVFAAYVKKQHVPILFFMGYLIMVLVYPYKYGGYRMLFPLIPVMWILLFSGVNFLTQNLRYKMYLAVCLTALFSFRLTREIIFYSRQPVVAAAVTPASGELFAAVKKYTPHRALIVCAKPRALALFTQRRGIFVPADSGVAYISAFIKKYHPAYAVSMTDNPATAIETLTTNRHLTEIVWKNHMYALYRIKQ